MLQQKDGFVSGWETLGACAVHNNFVSGWETLGACAFHND